MGTHHGLPGFSGMVGGDGVERDAELRSLILCKDACGNKSRCVGFAGGYLLRKKPPIEDDGTLPLFEVRIERLAKAAGPHLYGLEFVGH